MGTVFIVVRYKHDGIPDGWVWFIDSVSSCGGWKQPG